MSGERVYGDPSGWEHAIAHVDMDAFFVSCELLRRPDLRGKPVVVGPSGDRGVVAAASYEARRYGVHSAMPISTARRRCRDLITLRGDRDLYRRGSRAVMEVLEEFSDVVEVLGLDEAFVDLTGSPAPKARARQIKLRIRERTRLTCSVGIGPNRIIAKIASDLQKPDGICVLPRERFLEVIGERPARIIPGVGPKTEQRLAAAGIETVRQLAEADPAELESRLGPSHGSGLRRRAQGYGSTALAIERERKSESRERTFGVDETDEEVMAEEIERMAQAVASHLAEQGIEGRTVTLKIRLTPFRTFTRSRSLEAHTNDPGLVARTALAVFADFERDAPVRLLGVGVSNLLHPDGSGGGPNHRDDPSPTDLPPEEGSDGELRLPLD
ncbi:MAG: DNA polymerase IV [Solirubrobacterales bacterium]